jgi:hypothetical protein
VLRNLIFCLVLIAFMIPKGLEADPARKQPTAGAIFDMHPLMTEEIRMASEVRFYQEDKPEASAEIPFAVLSEQSHPHQFHLFKATHCSRRASHTLFSPYRVAFFAHGNLLGYVGYYPSLGWLVEPHWQNGQVPEELRKWLLALTSPPAPAMVR